LENNALAIMKSFLTSLIVSAAFTLTAANAAPPLSIDKALKIANGYLKENGRSDTAISGIVLEQTSIGGKTVWAVRWETPVFLSDTNGKLVWKSRWTEATPATPRRLPTRIRLRPLACQLIARNFPIIARAPIARAFSI
jgi:hypothetical protein